MSYTIPPEVLLLAGAAASTPNVRVGLITDTTNRVSMQLNASDVGQLGMGPGGGTARDVFIERDSAGVFQINSGTTAAYRDIKARFLRCADPAGGVGYITGAGGAVTQLTGRTTGVQLDKICGAITLFSAAGSATPATFTVTNSAVAATDTIVVSQKSGTDLYNILVTAVAAGSFNITFFTTGGTTVEQPVFNFAVIKAVAA